jgi:hypothetical protein
MLKYFLVFILYSLFLLIPLRNLRDENEFLRGDIQILEMEIIEKDKIIFNQESEVRRLKDVIKSKENKPKKEKRKFLPKNEEVVNTIQIEVVDTLK